MEAEAEAEFLILLSDANIPIPSTVRHSPVVLGCRQGRWGEQVFALVLVNQNSRASGGGQASTVFLLQCLLSAFYLKA